MGPRQQTGKAGMSWCGMLAGTIMLAGVASTSAIAATDPMVDCVQISGNLEDFDNEPAALSVDVVDHITTAKPVTSGDALNASPESTVTPTPVLYLTPRVASILRDVFGSDVDGHEAGDAVTADKLAAKDEFDPPAVAPIAERVDRADSGDAEEITPPDSLIERSEKIRPFRQQMYRTDI